MDFSVCICRKKYTPLILTVLPASYIPAKSGPFINKLTWKTIGEHSGLWNFTVGQNARVGGLPEKMFVAEKDIKTNAIYLVPGR